MNSTITNYILRNILLLGAIFISTTILAQTNDSFLNTRLDIKPGKYTVENLIELINHSNKVNIVYTDKTFTPGATFEVERPDLTLSQLLTELKLTYPIEYFIEDNYIIIKKKLSPKCRVSGKIIDADNGEPLPGANIYLPDANYFVRSNADGDFSMNLNPGIYILVASFIGYKESEAQIVLNSDTAVNIALVATANQIDQVTITSELHDFYNIDIGRPAQSIRAREIENQNVNNASEILMARLSGIWATKSSGMPGDHVNIRIRGMNSLFGSVDPLYIIDGVSVPIVNLNTLGIADLNIHDIENITILKDASSTALQGFQGGNGVIIIDSKHGTLKNQVEFTSKFGIEFQNKRYNLMNSKDFLSCIDSMQNKEILFIREYYPPYSDTLQSENIQDLIFRRGVMKEFQLSGSGAMKSIAYYVSGNYYEHSGVIENSAYERYTLSINAEKTFLNRVSVSIGYRGSKQKNRNNLDMYGGNNLILEGINKAPLIKSTPLVYYINEQGSFYTNRTYRNFYDQYRAVELTDSLLNNTRKSLDVVFNLFRGQAKVDITRNIFLNASADVSFRKLNYTSDVHHYGYEAIPLPGNLLFLYYWGPDYYLKSNEGIITYNYQANLNWQKKFNEHEFTLFAGGKIYKDNVYWNVDSTNQDLSEVNTSNEAYIRNSMTIHGPFGSVIREIHSVMGNLIYDYRKKYYVSLAANYENLKEGIYVDFREFFPSVALSWDIAKESGFNQLSWLNHFQLRADWGRSGNYPLNGMSDDLYGYAHNFNGTEIDTGFSVRQFGNHKMKPELVEERNLGVMIDLFNNSRIVITGDIFHKINTNLIIQRDIPEYYGSDYGTGKIFLNIGEIENKGKELSIEVIPINKKDFIWYTKFNISNFKQFVRKLADNQPLYFVGADFLIPDFEVDVNKELGNILGYRIEGIWTEEDQSDFESNSLHPAYINIGGYKFLNADTSNAVIDNEDKNALGNSIPSYTWNWSNSFIYKNFSIDFIWYASMGVSKYNATMAASYASGTNSEIIGLINEHGGALIDERFYQSSFFVEDASFIRLKQIILSYQPKRELIKNTKMKISVSFENIITLTKYTGYDPEASIYTDNYFSDNAIDRGAFPNPKAMYISLNIKF